VKADVARVFQQSANLAKADLLTSGEIKMSIVLAPYRRYFDFQGRSRREEFWMFALFQFVIYAAAGIVYNYGGFFSGTADAGFVPVPARDVVFVLFGPVFIVFVLFSLIPNISVTVRRLHDQNISGWWFLLCLIPYIGGIIILVMMCIDGTPGANRFGPSPKAVGTPQ
jgi:uncharacterized membrane protein YhaH (DUF805 family)